MIVAGGVYHEKCIAPHWDRLFGSGGRAAAAIASLAVGTELHAYVAEEWIDDVRASCHATRVEPHLTQIASSIGFHYFHALSRPDIHGHDGERYPSLKVSGAAVLRFGMLEGDAIVDGDRVVYDPQNWSEVLAFHENGSKAKELAIVLNQSELEDSMELTGPAAVARLMERTGAAVVVVKRGPGGATVHQLSGETWVPAFRSSSLFKIGSGDVFSAVFAHGWAEERLAPEEAALKASQTVATYVGSRDLGNLTSAAPLTPMPTTSPGRIYLAGPFFTLSQRWLIEEVNDVLHRLGVSVFSPLHEVGMPGNANAIATLDLAGLRDCTAVLALIDGEDAGTMFELGYARNRDIPVVAFSESPRPESLTMLAGTGCDITDDFATAVYRAVWASAR